MLQAITLNKAGRNISSNEVHWRELFRASEDSLTSTVFGLLLYLPNELFWTILNTSAYDMLTETPRRILSIEYWPHWDATGTRNASLVEPDIFIRTTSFDLIIEAKRYDYDQQWNGQWQSELQAYFNMYGEDKKEVVLLAVGGIRQETTQLFTMEGKPVKVIMCRWNMILESVKARLRILEVLEELSFEQEAQLRILFDLILGFRIHGYVTGEWFGLTDFSEVTGIGDQSIEKFINAKFKLNGTYLTIFPTEYTLIKNSSIISLLI